MIKKKTDNQPEERQKQIEEWKTKYLRALADYQNLERRTHQEKKELTNRLEENLISRLLPIIDVFDEMLKHDAYKDDQGLKSVRRQIHDVLQGYGVTHKIVVGTQFDPRYMECVDVKEIEEDKDNQVLEEVIKDYFNRDNKLIRPAKVVVGKKKES